MKVQSLEPEGWSSSFGLPSFSKRGLDNEVLLHDQIAGGFTNLRAVARKHSVAIMTRDYVQRASIERLQESDRSELRPRVELDGSLTVRKLRSPQRARPARIGHTVSQYTLTSARLAAHQLKRSTMSQKLTPGSRNFRLRAHHVEAIEALARRDYRSKTNTLEMLLDAALNQVGFKPKAR